MFGQLKHLFDTDPWRDTSPPTADQRYLAWVERHAEYEKQQRIRKARQRIRVLQRLDQRYASRLTVHVPPRSPCT